MFQNTEDRTRPVSIAVLIPCYNEEVTIGDVVRAFRAELPEAVIYVFDNDSSDNTAARAAEAGARVMHERRRGKGYVIQSSFRLVEADVYLMVDGDGTYPPATVHELVAPIRNDQADMVVGSRLHRESASEFRSVNRWGNRAVLSLLNLIFRVRLTDPLSGYRAFNSRFVRGMPLFGGGFEIEIELTIKAIARGFRIVEVPVNLSPRPEGSQSKIHLLRDGALIVTTILTLFRDYKPLTFFGSLGLLLIFSAFVPGIIVILEYLQTGLVPRLPSAVLAVGLALSGMLLISIGLILHSIARRSQELEHQLLSLSEALKRERTP